MTGEVVYLFAFDVASEVIPSRIGKVLGQVPKPLRVFLYHTSPRDVPLHEPLSVESDERILGADGRAVRVQARLFDIGVVSVSLRVPFEVQHLTQLLPYHKALLERDRRAADVAQEICKRVVADLGSAIVKPTLSTEPEAYTIFCLTDLGGITDVPQWLDNHRLEVAGLLSETDGNRLSEGQVNEALRRQQSFEKTDLVVIDWDAALVVDLNAYVDDVLFVIEMANLQLEEFRVLDKILDRQLNASYALADKETGFLIGRPPALLRQLRSLSVDLTKLADEVTNITKFLGDWYLARVYITARERFHLDQWRTSVEGRLSQLNELYSVLRSEVNERRMLWLEILIVVCFVIDLFAILVMKR